MEKKYRVVVPFAGHGCLVNITEKTEVPAHAERWVPTIGEEYWTPSDGYFAVENFIQPFLATWDGYATERIWLEDGLVFKTEEECQAYIDRKREAA